MILERKFTLFSKTGEVIKASSVPKEQKFCGTSVFWFCRKCRRTYAIAESIKDGVTSPWAAQAGTCPTCPGHRYSIPGDLALLFRYGDETLPREVYLHQLQAELDFCSSPDHPHNRKEI